MMGCCVGGMMQKLERASVVNGCEKGKGGIRRTMKRLSLAFILCLVWAGGAWAHGDISSLPNSVQILQYKLLLHMSPEDPDLRNKLAMAFYRKGQLEEAEKELIYALKIDTANFDALDGLGIVLTKMGKHQEALESLMKAVAINQQDVMVHVHLSVLYQKMNLPEKAQSDLEKARALASDPVELEKIEEELKLVGGQ
jgi:tetratricopeptide (TPR) repeat protein